MVSTQPPACTADEISPAVTVVTTLPDFMHNVQYITELLASFDSFTGMFDKSDGEITVPFLATSTPSAFKLDSRCHLAALHKHVANC